MEHVLKLMLFGSHGAFAYFTVFAILLACGLGIPLPEDLSLIFGGFLAHQGSVRLWAMMAVGFAGILVGDSLIFYAGRRIGGGDSQPHGFFARIVTPEKRAKVEELFLRHGQKIVMAARFLPGVRAVTYFTAGSAGMPYSHFIIFDGLAALVSAPLFVFLGFRFGTQLEYLIAKMKQFEITVGVGLAVALLVSFLWSRRKPAQRAEAGELERLGNVQRADFQVPRAGKFSPEPRPSESRVELSK